MSTVPPYAPPSVGPEGLVIATYPSIMADNLQSYLNIFGQNQYVAPDSAIYQLLSIISLKQADCNLGLLLAYNQTSPQTAIGAGLDRILKLNGIVRAPFSYSTASITLTGTTGTVITDGFVQDTNGNLWALPVSVTLVNGSAIVTATCTTPGSIAAEIGQINIISTPVSGWSTATNATAASTGAPVQSDSQVRAVQAISVALPSLTTLQSTLAAVLAVDGVTRVNPGSPTPSGPGSSIENPTGAVDSWGNPAHSVSMVVEGGSDYDVALAIYGARGIGPLTNGTTAVTVTDPNTNYEMSVSFFRPDYALIGVLITLTPLTGYTTTVGAAIQTGVSNYLNSLAIGESVVFSELYGAALTARPNPDQPMFSITSLKSCIAAAQTVATITSGSATVTVQNASYIVVGQTVVDQTNPASLPNGVVVVGISGAGGTVITLSAAALASSNTDTLAFFAGQTGDISLGFYTAAKGVAANVVITT